MGRDDAQQAVGAVNALGTHPGETPIDEDNQREIRYALRAATGIVDDAGPRTVR